MSALLAVGARAQLIPCTDRDGYTALHLAAGAGEAAAVDKLLSAGGSTHINITAASDGATALSLAAAYCHPVIVEKLLAAGASTRIANSRGQLPIHSAVKAGDVHTTKALLQADTGVEPAAAQIPCGPGDFAPLHLAVVANSREFVEVLVAAGADTSATMHGHGTPLQLAATAGAESALDALLQHYSIPQLVAAAVQAAHSAGPASLQLPSHMPIVHLSSGWKLRVIGKLLHAAAVQGGPAAVTAQLQEALAYSPTAMSLPALGVSAILQAIGQEWTAAAAAEAETRERHVGSLERTSLQHLLISGALLCVKVSSSLQCSASQSSVSWKEKRRNAAAKLLELDSDAHQLQEEVAEHCRRYEQQVGAAAQRVR